MRRLLKFSSAAALGLFLSAVPAFAGENLLKEQVHGYEALYGTYINYGNSDLKDYGYVGTGYLSLGNKNDSLQLGYSYTHIKYKSGSNLNQHDFTLAYSNFNSLLKNHTFTFGGHYINSDDDLTDGGYTLFFDGTYNSYQKRYPYAFKWNAGLGFYYSRYPNTVDFYVFQFTPHTAVKLFSSYREGALYLDLTGYAIHVSKAAQVGVGKQNYYSGEAALRYYYGPYDFKVGGWLGEQVFAVKNGGFVVYNLTEKYKGGAFFEAGYTFKNGLRLAFNLDYNRYKEVETNNNVNQTVATVSLGYRF
jgi:hypothetical protein